jgi:hypothetical protein
MREQEKEEQEIGKRGWEKKTEDKVENAEGKRLTE